MLPLYRPLEPVPYKTRLTDAVFRRRGGGGARQVTSTGTWSHFLQLHLGPINRQQLPLAVRYTASYIRVVWIPILVWVESVGLPHHTQGVQPSYKHARFSRLVASLIAKSTYTFGNITQLLKTPWKHKAFRFTMFGVTYCNSSRGRVSTHGVHNVSQPNPLYLPKSPQTKKKIVKGFMIDVPLVQWVMNNSCSID